MKENIILLHGALGSQTQVTPLVALLENTYTVYTLNFAGHGGRPFEPHFSIDHFAQNVYDFMQENKIDQAHFFGYSMGGFVALRLASKSPNLVQSITTLGTKFDWNPATAAKEVKMLNPDIIEQKVPKFAQKLARDHAPNDWKTVLHHTADLMLDLGNNKQLDDAELSTINIPVLIGIGDLDNMVSIEESKHVAQVMPNAKLVIMEGFYHPMEKNDLQVLAKQIQEFN